MPRKKADSAFRSQSYDIGNDCTVTVSYPAVRRPQMIHNDTEVVVRTSVPQNFVPLTAAARSIAATPGVALTNRELDAEGEARLRAIREAGLKQRESAAAIAASGDGAEGALTEADIKEFTAGLEQAALMGIQ